MDDVGDEREEYQQGNLSVCVGHKYMIDASQSTYVHCPVHHLDTMSDDILLEEPVAPIVYLPHRCGPWIVGGRDALIALREDIDEALEIVI
jgi:hypothetical protein